ncbi:hypothetical protein CDD82_3666 [Ophiocordyceps australis]|uniref:Pentacotripeptide-repeat region of PRORP domain-containing protein n=1 Tax=Ophiocordyceps australis TaxID=1399860 RepID=A0A2C5XN71_9HYPO|nr:hypothetical protein CDD82_3666 [Ophiocordyceps australis]
MCPRLGSNLDFGRVFMQFEDYFERRGRQLVAMFKAKGDNQRLAFESFRRSLALAALKQPCQPRHAGAILEMMKDGQLYEEYLTFMVERFERGLETKASLMMLPEKFEAWKKFPGVQPSSRILSAMFDIHHPRHKAELKAIYRDWINTWGDLDMRGYPRFLNYFADQGRVPTVEKMWHRYVARYPDVLKTMEGYRSLLHAYAQAGNQDKVDELLEEIGQKGIEMDTSSVNVLIKCAIQMGDSAKSFFLFEQLRESNMANSETYDLLMMAAAHKGDLSSVRTFLDASQEQSIAVTEQMARALVLVYCKNLRAQDAEKLCQEFAQHGLRDAQLWNMVIRLLGLQGRLTQCYEVLQRMRKYGVDWDGQTYEMLLIALVKVNQVQPAFQVLLSGIRDRVFLATARHYEIVIVGAARVEYTVAQKVALMMEEAGIAMTLPAHVALLEMAWQRAPTASRTKNLAKAMVDVLRSLAPAYQDAVPEHMQSDDRPMSALRPSDRQRVLNQMPSLGRGLNILAEMREFDVIEEVMSVYLEMFPEHAEHSVPPAITAGLMRSFYREGRSRRVIEMWNETLKNAKERWQYASNSVFAAHQYDLCTPLMVAMTTYRETGFIQGLAESVESMIEAGFKLTRSCWNRAIEYMAESDTHWERGMDWCEVMLMPNWRGWEPPRLKLETRRRTTTNRQELRPNNGIIVKLQAHWIEMRRMAVWSTSDSERLQRIEQTHPALYRAWLMSHWRAQVAAWVLPRRPSLNQAIHELLRPLTYQELRCMQRTLMFQLKDRRWQNEERDRPGGQSAFHMVSEASPAQGQEKGSTQPLSAQELTSLSHAIDSKLQDLARRKTRSHHDKANKVDKTQQEQRPASSHTHKQPVASQGHGQPVLSHPRQQPASSQPHQGQSMLQHHDTNHPPKTNRDTVMDSINDTDGHVQETCFDDLGRLKPDDADNHGLQELDSDDGLGDTVADIPSLTPSLEASRDEEIRSISQSLHKGLESSSGVPTAIDKTDEIIQLTKQLDDMLNDMSGMDEESDDKRILMQRIEALDQKLTELSAPPEAPGDEDKGMSRGPAPKATKGPAVEQGARHGMLDADEDTREKIMKIILDASPESVVDEQEGEEEPAPRGPELDAWFAEIRNKRAAGSQDLDGGSRDVKSKEPATSLGLGDCSENTENRHPAAPADPGDGDNKTTNEEAPSPPALGDASQDANPY